MIMSCRLTVKELSGDNSLCSPNADLEKPASCGSGTPFSEQTVVPEFVFLAPLRESTIHFIFELNRVAGCAPCDRKLPRSTFHIAHADSRN